MTDAARFDLAEISAQARRADLAWERFQPGVEIHRLWGDPQAASAALLRYAPGASVPRHRHEGLEDVFVLSGTQQDERGVYAAGVHVVNRPGTSHAVSSPGGCVVLVVWERPNTWLEP